jgi:hypothetical protein
MAGFQTCHFHFMTVIGPDFEKIKGCHPTLLKIDRMKTSILFMLSHPYSYMDLILEST